MITQSISGIDGCFDAATEVPEKDCFVVSIGPFEDDPNIEIGFNMWRNASRDTRVYIESDGVPQKLTVQLDESGVGISGGKRDSVRRKLCVNTRGGAYVGGGVNTGGGAFVGGNAVLVGSGAIAQGRGSVAVGEGGVVIGSNAGQGFDQSGDSGDSPGALRMEIRCAKPMRLEVRTTSPWLTGFRITGNGLCCVQLVKP